MKILKSVSTIALIGALSITMTACKGSSNSGSLSAASLESALKVKARTVSDADAQQTLSAMGLSEKSGPFDWGNMAKDGGTVSFDNWSDDSKSISADKITFIGLHMDGGQPSFDKVEIGGLSVASTEISEFGKISAKYGSVVLVGSEGGSAFIENLQKGEGIAALSGQGFAAGKITDTVIFLGEGKKLGNFDLVSFGPGNSKDTRNVLMTGLAMDLSDIMESASAGAPVPAMKVSMSKSTMTNVSKAYFDNMGEMFKGKMSFNGSMISDMTYDASTVENFVMDFGSANVNISMMRADGKKKGDVFTVKQVIEPSKITFTAANPVAQMMNITEMNFDGKLTQTIDSKKDTMSITDTVIDFKDQFKLDFAMEGNGILAMYDALGDLDQNNPDEAAIMENMMDLDYFKMGFTDKSIMDKIWEVAAAQQGGDAAGLKAQAKGLLALGALGAETPEQGKMIGEMTSALTGFIDSGGTLTFEMKPSAGFSFANLEQMADPGQALEQMGLKLSHSK